MGLAQPHNFHYAADEDWVMLYGLAGQNYTIQADNLGLNCQPVMELYGSSVTAPIAVASTVIDNMVFLDWQCLQDGVYYVRLWNSSGAATDTEYELAVYYPEMPLLGLIKGSITDTGGKSVASAVITTDYGYSALGSSGAYEMPHKGGGPFTLKAEAAGYQQYSQPGINLADRGTLQLNIMMTPTGGATTTTTTISSGSTTTTIGGTTTTTTVRRRLCPAKKTLGEDSPNLTSLRSFRDGTLAENALGRKVIQLYYGNVDMINAALERSPALKAVARRVLEVIAPMVGKKEE